MTAKTPFAASLAAIFAVACATPPLQQPSAGHVAAENRLAAPSTSIPQPVQQSAALAKPKASPKAETYSVVVKDVRAQELLFALARDARLNVDIHPGIGGTVTLNAIDQTLPQLLNRIAKQIDMRFELDGPNLVVMPDAPHLRSYKVDYLNMSRDTAGTVTVTTQIGSPGAAATGGGRSSGGAAGGSSSSTKVENTAKNHLWETLVQNIKDILQETDKEIVVSRRTASSQEQASRSSETSASARGEGTAGAAAGPAGAAVAGSGNQTAQANAGASLQAGAERDFKDYKTLLAASVIANAEAGVISVRATAKQHERVQEFLDRVMHSAQRQVLIEATVAEVQLSDNYQQGIDWSGLRLGAVGFNLIQSAAGKIAAPASSLFELAYTNANSRIGNISGTVKLLESFGAVKVLSTPKLSVMNNQTAVLKVVDNTVYFTIESSTNQNQTQTVVTYTTTVHTVPVGFVMNVTPQISDNQTVLLNIRPTISRIVGTAIDPNPALKQQGIVNEIPIIRSRELESMIRVENGNIAVMGGLMEDAVDNTDNAVPGAYKLPLFGNLFTHRNDIRKKTELVIFLRPTVIRQASIEGDFRDFRDRLPGQDFFGNNPGPAPVPEFSKGEARQ
jgi:general secretion pathway protein D